MKYFCFIICLIVSVNGNSQEAKQQNTNAQLRLEIQDHLDKRLQEEREILERQADRQYQQLQYSYDKTLYFGAGLIALVSTLILFFIGKTRKEARELMDEIFKRQVDEIVTKDIEPVRERLSRIQSEFELLTNYRNKKIVWIARSEDKIERTVSALGAVGVQRIEVVEPISSEVNIGEADLVVLSYYGDIQSKEQLRSVISQLKSRNKVIHLVMYTYGGGTTVVRLDDEELKLLSELQWFTVTNFPSTMISQVVSLIRVNSTEAEPWKI